MTLHHFVFLTLFCADKDLGKLHFRGPPENTLFDDGQVGHLPNFLQIHLLNLSYNLGLPSSMVALILCQFLAIPLAFLHHRMRNVFLRHLYSTIWGAIFLFIMFGWTSLHLVGLSACVYVLTPALPKGKAHSVVFFVSMLYLACLYEQF